MLGAAGSKQLHRSVDVIQCLTPLRVGFVSLSADVGCSTLAYDLAQCAVAHRATAALLGLTRTDTALAPRLDWTTVPGLSQVASGIQHPAQRDGITVILVQPFEITGPAWCWKQPRTLAASCFATCIRRIAGSEGEDLDHGREHKAMVTKTPKTKRLWNIIFVVSTFASVACAIGCNAITTQLEPEAARHHALSRILIAAMLLTAACSYLALYLSTWQAIAAGRVGLILIVVVVFMGLSSLNSSTIRTVFRHGR